VSKKRDHSDILVTIPLVFDEHDIREGVGSGGGHEVMIPPL
jgi:hypothetical protein